MVPCCALGRCLTALRSLSSQEGAGSHSEHLHQPLYVAPLSGFLSEYYPVHQAWRSNVTIFSVSPKIQLLVLILISDEKMTDPRTSSWIYIHSFEQVCPFSCTKWLLVQEENFWALVVYQNESSVSHFHAPRSGNMVPLHSAHVQPSLTGFEDF